MAPTTVILGQTGFIGQRLSQALAGQAGLSGFASRDADLTQKSGCERLAEALEPETRLIWCSAIKRQSGDSLASLEANLAMTLNLAELLAKQPVAQLIYLSSTAVYGEDVAYAEPIDEDTPVNPRSYYGMAKAFSEQILEKALQGLPTRLILLRPPLVYGPGEAKASYGPNLFSQALAAPEPTLTLWGEGEELREFLHVDDLVALIVALLGSQAQGRLNAVSGQSHRFRDIVTTLEQLSGKRFSLSHRPRSKASVDHRFSAARLHDWLPDFRFRSLADGLKTLLPEGSQ